jgi:lysozyme
MKYDERTTLRADLLRDEGLRLKPYRCPAGKLTIGVGRNIDDRGISESEALCLLDNDISECQADLRSFEWFARLDSVRQRALLNMRFQLGPAGFRGFTKMLQALAAGDMVAAARHGADSKWARSDAPARAARVLEMLETGRPV